MPRSAYLIATIALSAPFSARAEAPGFLLGDLGVRVVLPSGWRMTRWSDWDFKAETQDGGTLLFVWATPVQAPITTADGWGGVHLAKIEELKGGEPRVTGGEVRTIAGRPVALVDAAFSFGGEAEGRLYGASLEIAGQDLHLATVAPERTAKAAARAREALLEALEVVRGPAEVAYGGTVEASGIRSVLDPSFRPALEAEQPAVDAVVKPLGLEDPSACWTALRPRPGAAPDVMVACPAALRLGVVDEHSLPAVDAVVRQHTFGPVEVAPARPVPLADRLGLLYAPRDGLAVGVVPYDRGVARFWAVGAHGGALGEALTATLRGSTFSGSHPVELGEQVAYWLTHRSTSPAVLCPLLGLVALGGLAVVGVGAVAWRATRRPPLDPDDEAP